MKKFIVALTPFFALLWPQTSLAHVRYIADDAVMNTLSGTNWSFLLSPLKSGIFIWYIVATLGAMLLLYWFLNSSKSFQKLLRHIENTTRTYYPLIPWILRISIGILLIGAGTHGFLISPVLVANSFMSTIQVILGFFLLAGFLTGPTVLVTIMLFLGGLLEEGYLIGSFEVLAGLMALLILDARFPGIDDMVGIPDYGHHPVIEKFVPVILRVGMGVTMIYLAVYEKFLNPLVSAHVVNVTNLTQVIPVATTWWVLGAGLVELFLGILLIINWKPRLVAAVTFLVISLSFFYFEEDVAAHITLFGVLSTIFIYGQANMHKKVA